LNQQSWNYGKNGYIEGLEKVMLVICYVSYLMKRRVKRKMKKKTEIKRKQQKISKMTMKVQEKILSLTMTTILTS